MYNVLVDKDGRIVTAGTTKLSAAPGLILLELEGEMPANLRTAYEVVGGEVKVRDEPLEEWQTLADAPGRAQALNGRLEKLILARLVAQEKGEDVKPINDEIARLLVKSQAETAPKAPA